MANDVSFKWNQSVLNTVHTAFTRGMLKMGYDIANKARGNAPVLTSALKNSIRTTTDGPDRVYVIAGGRVNSFKKNKFNVPYAKRREYENKAHPSKKMYMHRAFNSVVRGDISKYFRSKIV